MVLELDALIPEHRNIRRLRAIGRRMERDAHLAVVIRASTEPNTVARIRSLLQIAGFLVDGVEASESGETRIRARRVPDPPDSFAVAAWRGNHPGTVLDLRYAPDETEWLDPHPHDVWSRTIASAMHSGAELVSH